MVEVMSCGGTSAEYGKRCRKMVPVKSEVEDWDEPGLKQAQKRLKLYSSQGLNQETGALHIPPLQYNLLDEPSPLGLQLKKSPSFLDLIQMRLTQGNGPKLGSVGKKVTKGTPVTSASEKLKASNFAASILRIGKWEYVSRYEGDLVAKCYFAKHKLVWEILDGSLKNKIEIQWSDIIALKANCPSEGPGTLDVVLARQPLFFRETPPQPRKHTLWQTTADFTGGQASLYRQHYLQCPQGLLGKHFEKLIQCDPRLNFLSKQPEIVLDFPYFGDTDSVLEDPDESKSHDFGLKREEDSSFSGLQDAPSRVMDTHVIEENGSIGTEGPKWLNNLCQIKVPGLHSSMSMSDLNKPAAVQNFQVKSENGTDTAGDGSIGELNPIAASCESKTAGDFPTPNDETNDVSSCKQPPAMSRKDSVGELLVNLPRIASLPQFLFNM
ncbi:uncharacterized protein LOC100262159 isoform X5 [Vitis vinifera]|uniref:uncharacterized protein LOC100262159 isoform X5 n=1 Tax=Vitis vinifera TaxID=29760 RepID=UPI001FC41802|nr:uncharacterized protein LOC100262159 isoform X5 [Vitis vinifera]